MLVALPASTSSFIVFVITLWYVPILLFHNFFQIWKNLYEEYVAGNTTLLKKVQNTLMQDVWNFDYEKGQMWKNECKVMVDWSLTEVHTN
jgi:hypothetical protein